MPQRTIKPPIINNRFTLYSCVVIAPITASNAPIPTIIQEITEFFSVLSFLIQQHSFTKFKFMYLNYTPIQKQNQATPPDSMATSATSPHHKSLKLR